ncbi:MAG TPA: phosphoribosyltransferase [Desulfobacteria bacterium]|nr:phosphoribosyltransferase [Desulfobacteria bacterium]
MQEKFSCTIVDWNYAYDLCKDVGEEIKAVGFKPEIVVGVARGGWYLARMLCDFFMLKDLLSLKMEHWGITATITGDAMLKYGLDEKAREMLSGKRVLIADDVTDTGDSLKLVVEYVKSLGAREVKTVTMHHKTSSSYVPDFYGELMSDWTWIVYPWSIHEDVMELSEKIIANEGQGLSLRALRAAMRVEFGFYVPYYLLRDVLENMAYHGKIKRKKEGEEEVWLLC